MISEYPLANPGFCSDDQIAEAARRAGREIGSGAPLVDERAPRRPFASVRGLVATWTICLCLTLLNLESDGLLAPRIDDPAPEKLVAGLKISAAIKGRRIETYLARHGSLPSSLAAVGLEDADPDLRYERLDAAGYRVVVRHGLYEGTFDSRLEAERRATIAARRSQAERELAARQAAWAAETDLWILEAENQASRHSAPARGRFADPYTDRAYREERAR